MVPAAMQAVGRRIPHSSFFTLHSALERWSLQPVLPRQDFFTKEIHRLLHGGKSLGKLSAPAKSKIKNQNSKIASQSPVLPWARLAYDACLSAGSTAILADDGACRPSTNWGPDGNYFLDNDVPKMGTFCLPTAVSRVMFMRVISRKPLRAFAKRFPEAGAELDAWFHEAEVAQWADPVRVKAKYGSASILKAGHVVFNICGNKNRLVVKINYEYAVVYVRFVGTHREYDCIDAETI